MEAYYCDQKYIRIGWKFWFEKLVFEKVGFWKSYILKKLVSEKSGLVEISLFVVK